MNDRFDSRTPRPARSRRRAAASTLAAAVLVVAAAVPSCTDARKDDPCTGVTCSFHGFCISDGIAPFCSCERGFHPENVRCVPNNPDDPCDGVRCNDHGTCRVDAGLPICDCEPGFGSDPSGLLCLSTIAGADADADGDGDGEAEAEADAEEDAGDPDDAPTDVPADDGAFDDGDTSDVPVAEDGGAETDGGCTGPGDCDDGIPCTVDRCDSGGCSHTPSDTLCADDGIPCTAEVCNPALGGCVSRPEDAACDDGVDCTTGACSPTTGCTFTPIDARCDDGIACSVDSCDPAGGCRHTASDAACPPASRCRIDRAGCAALPFVALLVDTSGSMNWTAAGAATYGDGSEDPWGARQCCRGTGTSANPSRLFAAKNAIHGLVAATADVQFALLSFPQDVRSGTSQANSFQSYLAGGGNIYYGNQVAGTLDFLRYRGPRTLAECPSYAANYVKVPFDADGWTNHERILSWVNHREYSGAWSPVEPELRADGATPLAMSLTLAGDYLSDILAADDSAAWVCRAYTVVLLTDGEESCQLPSDFDNAVTALRATAGGGRTKDVRTCVVGFNVTSASLDAAAVRGACPGHPSSAVTATDEASLLTALLGIVDSITRDPCIVPPLP
jgi:hypothetical protein